MYIFKIWVDADSCPLPVKNFIIDLAKAKNYNVHFAANHEVSIPKNNPLFTMHICPKTPGAADDFIFENTSAQDIVVTRDIPFAARLVEKKITVINDRGILFTKENIAERLSERDFNLNLAQIGLGGGSENRYSQKELKKFADTFEPLTSQLAFNEIYINQNKK